MLELSLLSVGNLLDDRYEIVRKLSGDGGSCTSYLAIDRNQDGKKCVIREHVFQEQGQFASFQEKDSVTLTVGRVSHLRHPQIQALQGSLWINDGTKQSLLLIKDYIEGETYLDLLNRRLQHQRVFSESEVVDFFYKILPVLDYIHQAGMTHSNICPNNIIYRDGDRLPVLLDFGSVNSLGGSIDHMRRIRSGKPAYIIWTPGYQPPNEYGPSSDLYALALTALILLTGRDIDTLHKFCDLHTCKLQVKVLCGHVSLSPEFGNILERLLQYHPHDRYRSATAVMEALLREETSR